MPKISKEQISKDETKILAELQKNSKKSVDTIAKHCGFSRQKVWRTIKKLEENRFIWGYTAVVDEQKHGLQKFILLFKQSMKLLDKKTSEQSTLGRLEKDFLEMGIAIESSYYIHGEYDWVLIFTAKDLKYAKKFCGLLLEKYPGIILKLNLMQILYTTRNHYIFNPNLVKLKDLI